MPNLITIDLAFRAEVTARLAALVPNRPVVSPSMGGRFTEYDEKEAIATPIEEFQGKPRAFYIGEPIEVNPNAGVGSGAVDRTYQYPLTIVYPRKRIWSSAMMDDVESIRSSLLNSTDGDVTGVCARFVHWEARAEVTPHDEDPWQYVVIPIWTMFRIS